MIPGRHILIRYSPWAVLSVAVASLGLAYTAEYVFGLEPCILCLYQRVPFAIAGVLAIAALALAPERRAMVIALCGLVFLVNAGIAFYHVGVEQHWWASVTGCGDPGGGALTLEQLRAALLSKPLKACDEVDWTFLGISMATYNVPYSLALAAASLAAAFHMRKP